jgi:pimeloyl-ACP methyl ester carboxylesterase
MKLYTNTIGTGSKRAALVHGITGDGGTWFELAPWIAEHGYTVSLVDQRGHGKSPRADSYTSVELGDDLVDTLPTGLDLIMGHSLGGRSVAFAVERLLPARAIYLDPAWHIPGGDVEAPRPLSEDGTAPTPATARGGGLRPIHEDGTLMSVDELAALVPSRSRAHIEQAIRSNGLFDPTFLEPPNFPLASYEPDGPAVVASLVVVADPSQLVPPELQERLRGLGYEVRIVAGGQHDLHVDNLEATKQAIEDWL